ncbi:MAG: hypothetical protein ACLT4I_08080 [Megamonas funiformis]
MEISKSGDFILSCKYGVVSVEIPKAYDIAFRYLSTAASGAPQYRWFSS